MCYRNSVYDVKMCVIFLQLLFQAPLNVRQVPMQLGTEMSADVTETPWSQIS
jgi:hypothetical protein